MKYIIANWKMNGNDVLLDSMKDNLDTKSCKNKVIICPPFLFLKKAVEYNFIVGAQDCSIYEKNGAFTGDVSAQMISEIGVKYVILGHSERRKYYKETDNIVNLKALNAVSNGIIPIICIGEDLMEYESKKTRSVLKKQLLESVKNIRCIVAYEPVWSIGTGNVPDNDYLMDVYSFLKDLIIENNLKIDALLYGGSVNSNNVKNICSLNNVDGVLIGGASLKIDEFKSILNSVK